MSGIRCQVSGVACRVSLVIYHMSLTPTATVTDPPHANSPNIHSMMPLQLLTYTHQQRVAKTLNNSFSARQFSTISEQKSLNLTPMSFHNYSLSNYFAIGWLQKDFLGRVFCLRHSLLMNLGHNQHQHPTVHSGGVSRLPYRSPSVVLTVFNRFLQFSTFFNSFERFSSVFNRFKQF